MSTSEREQRHGKVQYTPFKDDPLIHMLAEQTENEAASTHIDAFTRQLICFPHIPIKMTANTGRDKAVNLTLEEVMFTHNAKIVIEQRAHTDAVEYGKAAYEHATARIQALGIHMEQIVSVQELIFSLDAEFYTNECSFTPFYNILTAQKLRNMIGLGIYDPLSPPETAVSEPIVA